MPPSLLPQPPTVRGFDFAHEMTIFGGNLSGSGMWLRNYTSGDRLSCGRISRIETGQA
jgi:hypothetical protein